MLKRRCWFLWIVFLRRSRVQRKDCTRWDFLCLWGNLKSHMTKNIVFSTNIDEKKIFVVHLPGIHTHTPFMHTLIYACTLFYCVFFFLAFYTFTSHIFILQGLTFKNTDVYETIRDNEKSKHISWTVRGAEDWSAV